MELNFFFLRIQLQTKSTVDFSSSYLTLSKAVATRKKKLETEIRALFRFFMHLPILLFDLLKITQSKEMKNKLKKDKNKKKKKKENENKKNKKKKKKEKENENKKKKKKKKKKEKRKRKRKRKRKKRQKSNLV